MCEVSGRKKTNLKTITETEGKKSFEKKTLLFHFLFLLWKLIKDIFLQRTTNVFQEKEKNIYLRKKNYNWF